MICLEKINLRKFNLNDYIKKIFENKDYSFNYVFTSKSVDDTNLLAYTFAKYLRKKDIIVLNGELGSGKTVFVNSIAKYFNVDDQVSSPTFTIVNEYDLKNNDKIFHFDVYRIEDSVDFEDSIGTEYFSNGICIIEWGNIIKDILPQNTVFIDIKKDEMDDNTRHFNIWRNV